MIRLRRISLATPREFASRQIGTTGYLVVFIWSLGMVMLVRDERFYLVAAFCLLVATLVFPLSIQRLFRMRWLVLLAFLSLPPVFFMGDVDCSWLGIGYSSEGVQVGMLIALRFLVVLTAVDGFTASVDIASIAGLLERFGLHGLGFSMGVALNLLPALQQSSTNAWHSLWMRGGLRKRRWRGIQLLLITIVTNALRRSEEIALAAEARAFSPDCSRPMPMKVGSLDGLITVGALISGIGILLLV